MTVIIDGVKEGLGATLEISEIESLAKGTIIVGDSSGAPSSMPVGANGEILQADSSQEHGCSWTDGDVGFGTLNPNAKLDVHGTPGTSVGGFPSGQFHVTNPSADPNANAVITGHNLNGGNKQLWYLGSVSGSSDAIAFINRRNADLLFHTNNTERMRIEPSGQVVVGASTALARLHVKQPLVAGFQPVLYLEQEDVSEEMIEFDATIGVGNAIEAVAAKALTTTHFIKVTLPGGLTRYIPVGTIA